jgi:hypothetical protein
MKKLELSNFKQGLNQIFSERIKNIMIFKPGDPIRLEEQSVFFTDGRSTVERRDALRPYFIVRNASYIVIVENYKSLSPLLNIYCSPNGLDNVENWMTEIYEFVFMDTVKQDIACIRFKIDRELLNLHEAIKNNDYPMIDKLLCQLKQLRREAIMLEEL